MALNAGDKLGPYQIISLIGKGGMGEVYSAHDPRTGRDVAIKISAECFNERFDREVRAVAALNHPNICTLFDVGPNYLVMELVEGESPQGPMPLDTAMNYARQIAAALEEAHEKGVVHRDLKPGNIKIKPDGTVKVLDFGLAKMGGTPTAQSENSPTISMAATQAGMILGTAAYMAPEQAKGKPVDKRADIWAFGVVLHEMLTGERLFQHDDLTETLAAVVMNAPELERAPVEVRRLLKKCLEKDPRRRLRDIGDAWELLENETPRGVTETPTAARARPVVWIVSTIVLVLALAAGAAWHFRPLPVPVITRFPVILGEGETFTNTGRSLIAISPDGTHIVYVANQRLYLRSMDELEARPIPGTDTSGFITNPVFSPDGKSLAFWAADLTLKRVAVSGGAPVTICSVMNLIGLSWSEEGIVYGEGGDRILRVSPNGGRPEQLFAAKQNETIGDPYMMPGGVLFTLVPASNANSALDKAQAVVQALKSDTRKIVLEGVTDARYLPTGHLAYVSNGVLFAVPFDVKRLETTGGPANILEGVARGNIIASQFAFSTTGSLIYVPGAVTASVAGQTVLGLVDRKGDVEPLKTPPNAYSFPRVSRDGKRVAYQIEENNDTGIWIYELSGATAPRRLTLPGTGANRYPIWSSDNQRVAFQSDREGDLGIWWQRADGSGAAERLTKPDKGISQVPDSWSPDGRTFSFSEEKDNGAAIWTYSLRDKKATVLAETPGASLNSSVFSPDGRWVAYQLTAQPNSRIYVRPFPATATAYVAPVDADSHHPVWSPDGKELLYVYGPSQLGNMIVSTQPGVSFGSPVHAPKSGFTTAVPANVRTYDIMPDGKQFIGVVNASQTRSGATGRELRVVLNWFEDVKQRASGK